MGLRGPAPESHETLKRRGSTLTRYRAKDLLPDGESPATPEHLDGEAREEWDRVVKSLGTQGALSQSDYAALVTYCETWGEDRTLTDELAELPRHSDEWKDAMRQKREAQKILLTMWSRFGLTPADRPRVKITKGKGKDANGKGRFFQDGGPRAA